MAQSLAKLKSSGNGFTDIFNYQDRQASAPLLQKDYYVMGEAYMVPLDYIGHYLPVLKKHYPRNAYATCEKSAIFNVAAFNLSKHFGRQLFMRELSHEMQDFLTDFSKAAKTLCSAVATKEGEILLVCYPGKIRKEGWKNYDSSNKVKALFFAMLWDKAYISEKDLFDSNAMLGLNGIDIPAAKRKLEQKAARRKTP